MRPVVVLCVVCAIAAVACDNSSTAIGAGAGGSGGTTHIGADASVATDGGGDAAAGAAGVSGSGGFIGVAGTGGGAGAAGATGESWQKWCEPGLVNDAACPASEPTPGTACTQLGLECAYPSDHGASLDDCADQGSGPWWTSTGVVCSYDCSLMGDAGAGTPVDASSCASRPILGCEPKPYQTRQWTLDAQLEAIAQQCGVDLQHQIWIGLVDGCATSVGTGASSAVADCMAAKLAGVRFSCALDRECGVAQFWLTK